MYNTYIILYTCRWLRHWVGLYDLSNKRLLKQIQVISDPREDGRIFYSTHLNALLFRDTIQRHSFFDLRKSIFQFPDSDYSIFLKSLICNVWSSLHCPLSLLSLSLCLALSLSFVCLSYKLYIIIIIIIQEKLSVENKNIW